MALDCWTKIIIEPAKDRLVKLLLEQIHLFVDLINKYYKIFRNILVIVYVNV